MHKLTQSPLFALIAFLSDESDQHQRDGAIVLPYQKVIKKKFWKNPRSLAVLKPRFVWEAVNPFWVDLSSKDLLDYVENIII